MTAFRPEPGHGHVATALGLPAGAGPLEARAALLRRLPAVDFVPPPDWLRAYRALVPGPDPSDEESARAADLAQEQHLRDEVEDFAAEFFDLTTEERQRRWQAFLARAEQYPALTARLRHLAPGLTISTWSMEDSQPLVGRLARHLCEVFTLRPAARARKWQELRRTMQASRLDWQAAARRLQHKYPALAALAPELVDGLISESAGRGELARGRKRSAAPLLSARPLSDAAPANPTGTGWIVVAVMVVLGIVRVASQSSRSTAVDRPSRFQVPNFHAPNFPQPQFQPQQFDGLQPPKVVLPQFPQGAVFPPNEQPVIPEWERLFPRPQGGQPVMPGEPPGWDRRPKEKQQLFPGTP